MTDQQPKRTAETIRGQVITYLGHLDGAEVSLSELAGAVGEWHLKLSQVLRPLIRRGSVRVRSVDGKPRYRIGLEVPQNGAETHGTDDLREQIADLRALAQAHEARIRDLEAAVQSPQCAVYGHARDNQGKCHRCGEFLGLDGEPSGQATD